MSTRNSLRATLAALTAGGSCVLPLHLVPPGLAIAAAVTVGAAVAWLWLLPHRSTKDGHV
jgi:uncharacterized membrane protein